MKISVIVFIMLFSFNLEAQQYLYIKKTGKTPVERIGVFDSIKIKTEGAEDGKEIWYGGTVKMIGSGTITINQQTFLIKDIKAIRTYNDLLRLGGSAMYLGGTFFTAIAFVNRTINGDRPLLYPSQIILGAVLVSSGLIIRWISRNTYNTSKGYTFELIDFNKVE